MPNFVITINVLTLNIWGIPIISSDRETRVYGICDELSSGKYDIVSLQEVWSKSDSELIVQRTKTVLPYAHYFYSGVMGAGLLVLSKHPIVSAFFHAWSVNGYFHRIQHADWFGGKGVGLCKIKIGGHVIHLYNAHLHAEYDSINDDYKTHRVIQAFDTAQFIEATRGNSILQILAGDLNTQPQDISYNVLLQISNMFDSCSSDTVATNECNRNSYTSKHSLAHNPLGIRIDHIFVRSAERVETTVLEYGLAFPDRVPGHKFSFSDHEAISTKLQINLRNNAMDFDSNTKNCYNTDISTTHLNIQKIYTKPICSEAISKRISLLQESIELCSTSLKHLKTDRIYYYLGAFILTFILVGIVEFFVPSKIMYLWIKFLFFGAILFCTFMGSIWNEIERNGVLSGKTAMEIMLRDITQPVE
ncbi:putative neutral sphingomyelinase [Teleopsis dalmanni]|uniref:putative neutral sphingomyelinase n=1 Tax=Teleopsis dalmanni TaxID=139649 RepID=UPI0018CF8881|nr:putative neutral sphingomyelinase [Teleopsis dalmanni]